MSIAVAVAAGVQQARVGVLLEQAAHWPPVPGVTVFDLDSMRRELALSPVGAEALLDETVERAGWRGGEGGAKEYDRHIVRHVIHFLRAAGVEVVRG